MPQTRQPGKLAVIVHADIAGSTALVQQDEHLAHERIQDTFHRFGDIIDQYHGCVRELRGDALLAEFERASDAVTATLAFQANQVEYTSQLNDNILPIVRVGIALGEVVIADNTITGAGVVLAQRLEQLAEPGGLCISSAIREALPARLPFQYGLLGEQKVKGFDEPVRVFFVALGDEATMPAPEPHLSAPSARPPQQIYKSRWIVGAGALALIVAGLLYWLKPWEPTVEPADVAKMAYALPDKPSVAVLPFKNISKDEDQEYFSDGVTEDIITDLSKVSGLFVAAQDSTFAYKGSPVKIRQVAEDLGVRYVLEGSVQRSEDRIRVNAKLIDAVKGDHIWAERFDRKLKDVFAIQSEVAQHVAKALSVTIKAGEHERLFLKHTASIDAYDQFLRARRLVDSPGEDDVKKAEGLFKRAIEFDPNFASAYAGLSFNHSVKARFRFGDSPDADKQHALEFASKAIEVDPELAWGYIALGGAHLANGDPDAAVEAVRHALFLQPNGYEANLFMGLYLQFAGESAKAVEHLELAQRLNPVDTVRKLSFLGMAYFMNGNYEKSAAIWRKRMEKYPVANVIGPVFLAGSYAMLGRMKDASSTKEMLLKMRPEFHLSGWSWPRTYKKSEDYQRLYDAAIKAGIPEYPPHEPTADLRPALIVLPFSNISDDPEQEYFSDGFTEDVTTALARVPGFLVTARNTAFTYKDKNVDARTLGQELGVRYLLEGSVRKRGDRVRLNAQLIETQTGNHVWAETFDRPLTDIFIVQDDLVDRIVGSVASHLRRHEGERALSASPEKLQAYDLTVRARMLFKQNEFASVSEARTLLRKAIEVDPSYAMAHSRVLSASLHDAGRRPGYSQRLVWQLENTAWDKRLPARQSRCWRSCGNVLRAGASRAAKAGRYRRRCGVRQWTLLESMV